MPKVVLDKEKDQFFIAICKNGVHSFIMLGTYKDTRVSNLLCRVGKVFHDPQNPQKGKLSFWESCFAIMNVLFNKTQAVMHDENIKRKTRGLKPISYEAFDITYAQYGEFVKNLELLQTNQNQFDCYKPVEENGSKVTFLQTTQLIYANSNKGKVIDNSYNELSIDNTCRHSAIKLTETVIKLPENSMVSSYFFVNLLNHTKLEYGVPSGSFPFYVLPTPPTSFKDLSMVNRMVAEKLFSRMETLLALEPNSTITQSKFKYLKELYQQVTGPKNNQSLEDLLDDIHRWKSDHKSEIETLRRTYFWDGFFTRKSATVKMIEEIEHDIPQFKH